MDATSSPAATAAAVQKTSNEAESDQVKSSNPPSTTTKWLMLCMHPDGYSQGYGFLMPWPAELVQLNYFAVYNVRNGGRDPTAKYVDTLLKPDWTDYTEDDLEALQDEGHFGAGGVFLERRVLAADGFVLGDLNRNTAVGDNSVATIHGVIHYWF
jgi:hypothetical protein